MTLPFQNSNQRKYRCFVCEEEFEEYGEYREHIIGDHEEGREYIVCKICAAPVRDVKMHFKAKHKGSPVQPGLLKALVWKDTGGRKRKKKPSFRSGDFVSAKNGGKLIHYRSGWECKCYELLEEWDKVVAYAGEPIRIPYLWMGEERTYKPDIVIDYADGRREVWEIKPANQTNLKQNKAKWHSAKEYCHMRDWEFIVITEKGLNKLRMLVNESI